MPSLVINSDNSLQEEWRDVPGYEGVYQASNLGRVRTVDRLNKTCYGAVRKLNGRIVAKYGGKRGYLRVSTREYGVLFAHRLVAIAWIPNPNYLPVINHIDGNKSNNHPANLEWCTQTHNMQHAHKTGLAKGMKLGRGDKSISAKLTESIVARIKRRLMNGERAIDIAREYGVSKNTIAELKAGRSWGNVNAAND